MNTFAPVEFLPQAVINASLKAVYPTDGAVNLQLPFWLFATGHEDMLPWALPLCEAGGALTSVHALRDPYHCIRVTNALTALRGKGQVLNPQGLGHFDWLAVNHSSASIQDPVFWQQPMTAIKIRTIWARRVALSLLSDFEQRFPWKFSDFPRWHIGVMLDYRPEQGEPVVSAESNGQSYLPVINGQALMEGTLPNTGGLFDPEPFDFYWEAQRVLEAFPAQTPMAAVASLARYMRTVRFTHGYHVNWFSNFGPLPDPPGGYAGPCTGTLGLLQGQKRYYGCAHQVVAAHWGGCPVNSTYAARVLQSMNIPACRLQNVQVPTKNADVKIASYWDRADAQVGGSDLLKGQTYVGGGQSIPGHNGVLALGAGLGYFHGDELLVDYGVYTNDGVPAFPAGAVYYTLQLLPHNEEPVPAPATASAACIKLAAYLLQLPNVSAFNIANRVAWANSLILRSLNYASKPTLGFSAVDVMLRRLLDALEWPCVRAPISNLARFMPTAEPASALMEGAAAPAANRWPPSGPNAPAVAAYSLAQGTVPTQAALSALWANNVPVSAGYAQYCDRRTAVLMAKDTGKILESSTTVREHFRLVFGSTDATPQFVGAWAVRVVGLAIDYVKAQATAGQPTAEQAQQIGMKAMLLWAAVEDIWRYSVPEGLGKAAFLAAFGPQGRVNYHESAVCSYSAFAQLATTNPNTMLSTEANLAEPMYNLQPLAKPYFVRRCSPTSSTPLTETHMLRSVTSLIRLAVQTMCRAVGHAVPAVMPWE
ncbi:MAG: hypothetical protein FJ100_22525 [Deltaproteobacteria bacterium]|nr:hypothetical protein [Deltaproteobacteria bacterium]